MSGGARPPFLLGTAFTYQGRLIDANRHAEGTYNAMFVLWDFPEGPNELGITGIQKQKGLGKTKIHIERLNKRIEALKAKLVKLEAVLSTVQ